jgi:hypothetical protein
LILDGYLGTYSNAQSLNENYSEENSVLSAAIPNYPIFSVEPIGKDLLSLKEQVEIQFNEIKLVLIVGILKNTIYKDK